MKKNGKNKNGDYVVIQKGMVIIGEMYSSEDIIVEGKFTGDLETKGKVIISKEGYVEGNVKGRDIIVYGKGKGDFVAINIFQLYPVSIFTGSAKARLINVSEEAHYDGTFVTLKDNEPGQSDRNFEEKLNSTIERLNKEKSPHFSQVHMPPKPPRKVHIPSPEPAVSAPFHSEEEQKEKVPAANLNRNKNSFLKSKISQIESID